MELQVQKIDKRNGKELLVMKVMADCNLLPFIVFDTTYEDDELSNLNRHSFMFPNQNVKVNDYVLLYTGEGENTHYPNRGGSTTWEFYWGLNVNVWNAGGDEVVIIKAAEVKRYPC